MFDMMQWYSFNRPPKEEMHILLLYVTPYYGIRNERTIDDLRFTPDHRVGLQHEDGPRLARIAKRRAQQWGGDEAIAVGWMPAGPIYDAPIGYDLKFGDDRPCLCGHPYYRHFDTYEAMAPIGCKYCGYRTEADEGIEYRKESRPDAPEEIRGERREGTDKWDEWYETNKHLFVHSLCSGFKLDVEADAVLQEAP